MRRITEEILEDCLSNLVFLARVPVSGFSCVASTHDGRHGEMYVGPSVQAIYKKYDRLSSDHELKRRFNPRRVRSGYRRLSRDVNFDPQSSYRNLAVHLIMFFA